MSADHKVESVSLVSKARQPSDAAFADDAATVYITATGLHGRGVIRLSTKDGSQKEIHTGAPFVSPQGLVLGHNGDNVYVADPGAKGNGQIFELPTDTGIPKPIPGAAGMSPRGMELVNENGVDVLYFTGQESADGRPGVFKLAVAEGAKATVIAVGRPFVKPDSIAVSRGGSLYVTDHTMGSSGSVFRIADGKVVPVIRRARLGTPAGIALTLDDSTLLISSYQPGNGHAQVLVVDLKTEVKATVTKVIGMNTYAGGLHRSRNSDSFSWAGLNRVYGVILKAFGG